MLRNLLIVSLVRLAAMFAFGLWCAPALAVAPPAPTNLLVNGLQGGGSEASAPTVPNTTPAFFWTPSSGASHYGLYIRDMSTNQLVVDEDRASTGTAYLVPAGRLLAGRTFKWNMAAYNSANEGRFSPAYFFKVQPPPPPPATVTPPNPPTMIAPGTASGPGTQLVTLTPTMQWNLSANATGHGLYISRNDSGSWTLIYDDDNVPNHSFLTVPSGRLENGKQYRWNMRAKNSAGWGAYTSERLYFQTPGPPPPPPVSGTPNLRPSSLFISPSNGAPGSTAFVGFNVTNAGNAASRQCQVNVRITQPNVAPTSNDPKLAETFTIDAIPAGGFTTVTRSVQIPSGLSDGDRSVWVIVDVDRAAGQAAADESDDRASTLFRVAVVAPTGPNLVPSNFSVSPSSGAAGSRPWITFGVVNSGRAASAACTAQVRLSSSASAPSDLDPLVGTFTIPSISANGGDGVADRIDIPADAASGLKYLWLRVDANNAAGQAPADRTNDLLSTPFTVSGGSSGPPQPPPAQNAPGPFTLLAPTNGVTNVAHAPLLDWSDAAGAETYIITIDDHADFRSPLPAVRVSASESSYQFPTALSKGKRYTWKVDAVSSNGVTKATPATSSFVVTSSAAPSPPPPTAETVPLQSGVVFQIGNMAKSQKRHFRLAVPPGAVGLSVTTAGAAAGDVDIYLQRGQPAGMERGQFTSSSAVKGSNEVVIVGDGITSGDYFVMVYAKKASNGVSIVADFSDDPAARKGTVPKPAGVSDDHELLPQIQVSLRRADNPGPNSVILRNAKTWLVIHGRESSPGIPPPLMSGFHTNNIGRVVLALSAGLSSERGAQQVLVLDWSAGASDNQSFASDDLPAVGPPSVEFGGFEGSYWIPSVAAWAAQQLNDLGISGENLHIVGHSWGTYVACELSNHMRVLPSSLGNPGSVIALDPARRIPGTHYSGAGSASLGIESFPRSAAYKTSVALSNQELVKSARWSIDTRIDAPGLDFRLQVDQHGNGVEMLAGMLERLNGNGAATSLDKLLDPHKMIDQRQPVPSRKKGWSFLDNGRSINGYDALLCARFVTDATGAEDDRGADQWQPETLYTCMAASPSACVDRATPRLFGVLSCLSDEAASGIFPPDAGTIRSFNRTSLLRVGTDRLGLVDARFNVAVYQFNSARATSRVKISSKVVDGVRRDDLHVALCDPSPVNVVGYARLLQKTTNADGELQQVFAVDPSKDYYPVVYSDGECATRFSIRVELIP